MNGGVNSTVEETFKAYRQYKRQIALNIATVEEINCVVTIENIVDQLPGIEREIIEKRYMDNNADYLTDYEVYENKLTNPISSGTYRKYRLQALNKLHTLFGKAFNN